MSSIFNRAITGRSKNMPNVETLEFFKDSSNWTVVSNTVVAIEDNALIIEQTEPETLSLVMDDMDLSAFETITATVEVIEIGETNSVTMMVVDGDGTQFTDSTPAGETGTFGLSVDIAAADAAETAHIEIMTAEPTVLDVVVHPIRGLFG